MENQQLDHLDVGTYCLFTFVAADSHETSLAPQDLSSREFSFVATMKRGVLTASDAFLSGALTTLAYSFLQLQPLSIFFAILQSVQWDCMKQTIPLVVEVHFRLLKSSERGDFFLFTIVGSTLVILIYSGLIHLLEFNAG